MNYSAVRGALRFVASDNWRSVARSTTRTTYRDRGRRRARAGHQTVNPNVQPVQGVTTLPVAAFVPPRGLLLQLRQLLQPGRHVHAGSTSPTSGRTTPMDETRPDDRVTFNGLGRFGTLSTGRSRDRLSLQSISAYREYDCYFANDNDLSPLASSLGYRRPGLSIRSARSCG